MTPASASTGKLRPVVALCAALTALAPAANDALAQSAIQKPLIHLIVPYPPGGGDVLARMVAEQVGEQLGRRIIVENKPGADGALAADYVKRAAPDGSTLFFATNTQMAGVPAIQKNVTYDPVTDFTPVSLIGVAGFFLFVNADVARTMPELVQKARAAKDKPLACGISNLTSLFAVAQLTKSQNFTCTQVTYRGDGAALPALVTREIDMLFATVTSAKAFVDGGQIRMLATTLNQRSPLYPDVPTLEEIGIPGIKVAPFIGFFGPPNMPKDVTMELAQATKTALQQPTLRKRLGDQAIAVEGTLPEPLAKMVKEQLILAKQTVEASGIERQ
jgi:tripartite-type tricarboxylate transporter receptor subunit TctC